jgi:hypothetical protein
MFIISYLRTVRSNKDFSDAVAKGVRTDDLAAGGQRVFGRPFKTSGNEVVIVAGLVIGTEIALFVLVMML